MILTASAAFANKASKQLQLTSSTNMQVLFERGITEQRTTQQHEHAHTTRFQSKTRQTTGRTIDKHQTKQTPNKADPNQQQNKHLNDTHEINHNKYSKIRRTHTEGSRFSLPQSKTKKKEVDFSGCDDFSFFSQRAVHKLFLSYLLSSL